MADISKIALPDGTVYDIKDANATDTTYDISMSSNIITLTSSRGDTSSITLPVYDGGVE